MTDQNAPPREHSYKSFPKLAAYIDRVGAEQKNFLRYLICEYKARGYYHERAVIKLLPGGEIEVKGGDASHRPNKTEADAIRAEMAEHIDKFPTSLLATEAKLPDLRKVASKIDKNPNLFMFYSRQRKANSRDGNIIMVQQRVEKSKGDKYFVNWSFWSDGLWRAMEPNGLLPFWKPKVDDKYERGGKMIMVHEGPKTAKYLTELLDRPKELAKHPYGDIFARYEHWGMIGGALAPQRSDWEDLVAEKPAEVIYVCDNDPPGKNALQRISKEYKRQLLGVMFDERFPLAFDFGDPMPAKLFSKDGRWTGPRFEDLMTFATHATDLMPQEKGAGRPVAFISDHFANEWLHCVTPEVFVHKRWPNFILNPNEFNNHVAPFSDVDDTARLLKKRKANKTAILSYQPGMPSGIYTDPNGTYINTHVGTAVAVVRGEDACWEDFLRHLVPNDNDRLELKRWCATLIDRPDIKMLYGALLISEAQGIGKGTLGERILAPLVGASNVSYPSESEIVDSNYNYWAAHKRLAVVHEIYAGHSAKAYNKLKSIITDRTITVSKKYQANYEIENWIHILACSNSTRAIQLSMDDRRWFVPKLTEEKKPAKYWQALNDWLQDGGGLGIIRGWASGFLTTASPVMRGEDAPWSEAKKGMIEDGYSPGMNLAGNLFDLLKHSLTGDSEEAVKLRDRLTKSNMFKEGSAFVVDLDVIKFISLKLYEGRSNDRLEKPGTIRKVAKARGWHIGTEKIWHYKWGQERYGGRLISLLPKEANTRPSDLEGLVPIDLATVVGM